MNSIDDIVRLVRDLTKQEISYIKFSYTSYSVVDFYYHNIDVIRLYNNYKVDLAYNFNNIELIRCLGFSRYKVFHTEDEGHFILKLNDEEKLEYQMLYFS